MQRGLRYIDERHSLSKPVTEVSFNLERISERFAKKFGANSCVFRATMQTPAKNSGKFMVKNIMSELSTLFSDAIEQVNLPWNLHRFWQYVFSKGLVVRDLHVQCT